MARPLLLILYQLVDLLLQSVVLGIIIVVILLLGNSVILAPAVVDQTLAFSVLELDDLVIDVARLARL